MKKGISLLFIIVLFASCKPKFMITEGDLTKSYEYKENLTDKEMTYFSEKLNVKKELITNQKLYVFVKSWEETTYLFGGMDKRSRLLGINAASLQICL